MDNWPSLQNLYLNGNRLNGTLPEVNDRREGGWVWRRGGVAGTPTAQPARHLSASQPPPPLFPPRQAWGQAGAMPSLLQLRADSNALTGTLPANWGSEETSMRELGVL